MTRKSAKLPLKPGARLAQLRKAAGLSQRELASLLGVSHTNIAFWEHSDKPPRSDLLPKLADILGVRIEVLLDSSSLSEHKPGPSGRAREVFQRVALLPRSKRDRLLDVVSALLDKFEHDA